MFVRVIWFANAVALVYCNVISANASENKGFTLEQGIPHLNTQPYFLPAPANEVTTLEGQSAYLHCRVAQLGDKKVSWIRTRDLHVLTSGLHTFASDQRFIALHAHRSENWTLQIRFSQTRDSGEYQCQVNTEPKLSMRYYLRVQEAATVVQGSDQRYVRAGSTIQLSCKAPFAWQPPGLLYWYHDTEILHHKGRISIDTHLGNDTYSNLVIEKAQISDSGNYTCWPTKFLPASVMVHVLPDENAAAKSLGVSNNIGAPSTTKDLTTSSATPVTSPLMLLLLFLYLSSVLQLLPNR
ncbi:neural cell adhesion molecule L1-like isoform X1 [Macrobrachium rosenbergii]|uniref:neural cell adhesion molecule L1-like isoform X1 n=1 Tax=Macrobrachium rosenbergii TaxID=79674 RepID=UPI0034D3F409